MSRFELKPIGVVRRTAPDDEVRREPSNLESIVEVFPEYRDALDGLKGYSHVFVLAYFHKLRPEQVGPLKVRPRRMVRAGLTEAELPLVGVFALGSPSRPNPVGLSLVRLDRIEAGGRLVVRDLEYFDGTPVVDIKPYSEAYRAEEFRVPRWVTDLHARAGISP